MSLVFMSGSVGAMRPGQGFGDPGNWLSLPDDWMRQEDQEGEACSPHLSNHITIGGFLSNTAGFLQVTAFVQKGTSIMGCGQWVAKHIDFVDKTTLIGYKRDRPSKES